MSHEYTRVGMFNTEGKIWLYRMHTNSWKIRFWSTTYCISPLSRFADIFGVNLQSWVSIAPHRSTSPRLFWRWASPDGECRPVSIASPHSPQYLQQPTFIHGRRNKWRYIVMLTTNDHDLRFFSNATSSSICRSWNDEPDYNSLSWRESQLLNRLKRSS